MINKDPEENQMGLMDHLRELRRRLFWSAALLLIGTIAAYNYSGMVFDILKQPYFASFSDGALIGTGTAEAWVIKIKVAIFSGALLVSPLLFYQLWLFIAPAMYEDEKKLAIPFVLLSTLLFAAGVYFCYSQVLPITFKFFSDEYKSIGLTPQIKLSEHLSMMTTVLISFGAVFELPLLTWFLARLGVIDHKALISGFRVAVLIIFVVAAVLTPPDVLTQFLMAGPLLVLYVISIGVAWLAVKMKKPETASQSLPEDPSAQHP